MSLERIWTFQAVAAAATALLLFKACLSLDRWIKMNPSRSRKDVERNDVAGQADIFLSHSGYQKSLVELLYEALKGANQTAFFDKYTLDKASHFPSDIMSALGGCKLGVIVLSNEFLNSKWPMLELGMLHKQQTEMLPLFYKLSIEDLNSDANLSKWRRKWRTLGVNQEDLEQWEKAVKNLASKDGEVFKQQEGEVAYIEKVVKVICNRIPSNPVYDLSRIQGHKDLAKEIGRHFDELDSDVRRRAKASMVGLHGIRGSGKTTLCKIMVNFFNSRYVGRSCLIDFSSSGDDFEVVVQDCKMALKKLANLSELILGKINSYDQVVKLMMEHVSKVDVFIAIDNVRPDSEDEARRLLELSFTAASKVMLTSRSEDVLWNLLDRKQNRYIGSLPCPNHEHAFQIFQQSVDRGDLSSLPVRNEIERVLSACTSYGQYHPLALKELGRCVRGFYGRWDSEINGDDWSCILEESLKDDMVTHIWEDLEEDHETQVP